MKRSATILLTLTALAGAPEFVPTLSVNASGDGSYSIEPLGSSILTVRSEDDATIYMKATLGKGDLVPVGTTGAAYTSFTTGLTDVYVTEAGKALGPAALSAVVNSGTTTLDFDSNYRAEAEPTASALHKCSQADASAAAVSVEL